MKNLLSALLCVIVISVSLNAQRVSSLRQYATQLFTNQMRKDNPKFVENQAQIEAFIKETIPRNSSRRVTVPIVFHIIQSPNQVPIKLEEIEQQLAVLNNSFSGDSLSESLKQRAYTKGEFDKKAALTEIDFCLAEPYPGSGEQSPILFYTTSVKEWPISNDIKKAIKAPWDAKKYLNIWVANLEKNYAGFAQMPGGAEDSDGIVIDANYFGTNESTIQTYNRGKTLTHLVGSYLGLYELWNETQYCGDDFVEDTPVHNAPNNGKPIYKHVSLCGEHPVEMTMNFMDNTDDDMLTMFTLGQKLRMQAILSEKGPRGSLGDNLSKCKKEKIEANLLDITPVDAEYTFDLKVFPNPASNKINIDVKMMPHQSEVHLWVMNAAGSLIQEKRFSEPTAFELLTDLWPQGMYTVKVISLDGQYKVQRVLITH